MALSAAIAAAAGGSGGGSRTPTRERGTGGGPRVPTNSDIRAAPGSGWGRGGGGAGREAHAVYTLWGKGKRWQSGGNGGARCGGKGRGKRR